MILRFLYWIRYEQFFSVFQCQKVLRHMGLSYRDLFDRNTSTPFKENIYLLAYYVLKSILLFRVDAFLLWIMNKNEGSFRFVRNADVMNSFCELIRLHAKDPIYLKWMEEIEKWGEKQRQTRPRGFLYSMEMKTLRMTVVETM